MLVNLTWPGDDVSVVCMMNLHEAKAQLSALVEQAADGEEIIIGKYGKPMAKLVPFKKPKRKPGKYKGKIWISKDFDAPMPDIEAAFENSVIE
jgi:prevent-host-death family protein